MSVSYPSSSMLAPLRRPSQDVRVTAPLIAIAYAEPGQREPDGSVWIEVLRTGSFHSSRRGGGPASGPSTVAIDTAMLASVASGFAAARASGLHQLGLPVRLDPDHSKPNDPAVGRGLDLRVSDDGARLLMRVAWDDGIADAIRRRQWESVSIEMDPPSVAQDKTTGSPVGHWTPTGLVVTNRPYIHGMTPIAASERREEIEMKIETIRTMLGLSETVDEAGTLAALSEMRALAARSVALTDALATTTQDRDALRAEVATLGVWKREQMLDAACADGRIAVAERDLYARTVLGLGEADAAAIFPIGRIKTAPKGASASVPAIAGSVEDRFGATINAHVMAGRSYSEAYTLAEDAMRVELNNAIRAPRGEV